MQAETLISGGVVVCLDPNRRVIENGAVAVAESRILAVGKAEDLRKTVRADRILDCTGHIVFPGLIDVHAHAGHGLIKSMGMHHGNRWEEICGEVYTKNSPPEFWYAESRLAALERLRFGVTTGVSLLGGGDTIMRSDEPEYAAAHCRGVAEVGTRSVVAVGPTRAPHPRTYARWNGPQREVYPVDFQQQMETCAQVVEDWHGSLSGRIRIAMLYPVLRDEHERDMAQSDYAAACEQSRVVRGYARDNGLLFTQDGHWRGSIRRAENLGLLGPDSLLSHCIDLHEDEIALIAGTETKVAHNPSANASIVGRCPAIELMAAGATVALGSDATAPDRSGDMFRHMQQAMHYHRRFFKSADILPIGKVLEMCTIDSARALGMADQIGSIERGKQADIVTMDLRRPHLFPPNMALHRLVCFANGNDVTNVMVAGNLILDQSEQTQVEQDVVLRDAARETALMIQRIEATGDLELPSSFWGDKEQTG